MSIKVDFQGSVALITINRPEAMNAMTKEMDSQLRDVWPEVNARREILSVVITGAGDKAFCSGADIGTLLPQLRQSASEETDCGEFARATDLQADDRRHQWDLCRRRTRNCTVLRPPDR
jgi:E-phenylitaconyl-CoA hydratase